MLKILVIILGVIYPSLGSSHSPLFNNDKYEMTKNDPYLIKKPEHSKAIFSELKGTDHYYKIESKISFKFYVGITAPKLDTCDRLEYFSFEILDSKLKKIDNRDGKSFEWWAWYEEYGKKWYWVGPELGEKFAADRSYTAGTYYIRVFNEQNTGKYVLAVGDIEKFPLTSIPRVILTVKKVNKIFWSESNCK
ncbi:MAG: hypothetical protein O3A15_01360 [Proteobacteria bacterium]|jgi:hypothetical protein|nr:hypothetical protein [Pseudomonadota bacterium]